jgi:uncharacterized protein
MRRAMVAHIETPHSVLNSMQRAALGDDFAVRVTPDARRREWSLGDRAGAPVIILKLAVSPEGGKANAELIQALSNVLDMTLSRITIASGHTSREKRIVVSL